MKCKRHFAIRTSAEEERKKGSGDLPPEKFIRTTPFRTLENVLLEHRVDVAIISNLGSQKQN